MHKYSTTREIKRTYTLPKNYTVTFKTVLVCGKPYGFNADWQPCLPPRGKYYKKHIQAAYMDARHDFFTEVSRQIGGACVVVEG